MARDPYASLKQGLVGAWIPSVSGSGLLLPDLSMRGNNGVLTGMDASDWVASGSGRALDFDGVNDEIKLAGTALSLNQMTISVWAFASNFSQNGFFFEKTTDGSVNTQYSFFLNSPTTIIYRTYGLSTLDLSVSTTTAGVINNTWNSFVATFDGSLKRIYVNGKLAATSLVLTGNVTANDTGIALIGRHGSPGGYPFNGQLDDIRIYNRALTESEIKLLASDRGIGFKRKRSAFSTRYTYQPPKAKVFEGVRVRDHDYASLRQGLVGAWCPSLPNGGSGNLLVDQSGRGNNGTLTNMGSEDWVASGSGRALDFDGSNDYVAPTIGPVLSTQYSVTAWIYARTPNTNACVTAYRSSTATNPVAFQLYLYTAKATFTVRGDTGTIAEIVGNSVAANQWTFLTAVRRDNTIEVFANGVSGGTASASFGTITANSLLIGALNAGGTIGTYFNGILDDIRIYNRALTESEIRLLASKRGIGLQPSPTRFIAKEKKTGLRRLLLTGQT